MDTKLSELRRDALSKNDAESWQRYAHALEQIVGVPKKEKPFWGFISLSKIPLLELLLNKASPGYLMPVKVLGRVDKEFIP